MPAEPATLLPPNVTPLERALEAAAARIADVPAPLEPLWNPATCPPELLPWLAWGVSVDFWDPDWSIDTKRTAVADSISRHRRKGTPAAIDTVLTYFDELLELVEWHQTLPRGRPHTFDIVSPTLVENGVAVGGERVTAAFVETVVREVGRVKPLREHFRFVQSLVADTTVFIAGAAAVHGFDRFDGLCLHDPSPRWPSLLLTEQGEPLQDEAGVFMQEAA